MSATCGNSVVFCTFWNIGTCCCVTMSTSDTRSVCWLWWTSTVFLSVWMGGTWCCFAAETSMIMMCWTRGTGVCYTSGTSTTLSMGCACTLHWDIDNLVNELHLRDFHSYLHLLNHRQMALHTTGTFAICFPPAAATAGSWDAAASGDQFATALTVGRKDAATSDFGLKCNPRKAITYSRRSAPKV